MSDPDRLESSPASSDQTNGVHDIARSAGGLLRLARQEQGLHIVHLAVMLKVPPSRLEDLEANRFEAMPDMVYVRALFASACRCLKIDPEPGLTLLPAADARPLHTESDYLNQAFDETQVSGKWFAGSWRNKPLNVLLMLVVVAILLVLFWPSTPQPEASPREPGAVKPTASTVSGAEPVNKSTVQVASGDMLRAAPTKEPSEAAPAPAATPAAASPGVAHAQATVESKPDARALLSMSVADEVWLMVTDARGVQQVQRTAMRGEVINITAEAPLSVVLGRADKVEVRVRGVVLDVSAWSQGNVARFEVK